MSIVYHKLMIQGSDEWAAVRCGLPTASEMKLLVTPATLKPANNDKERAHMWELLAQRITKYVEPRWIGDDMLRGQDDEITALDVYDKTYGAIQRVGFVTNDKWGFTIGYSPDALIGEDGQVECKSRKQSLQIKTLVDYVSTDTIDPDFSIQVQTGLMVTERKFCDLVSYCGGLPMATVRVYPEAEIQDAILSAAANFEARLRVAEKKYNEVIASNARLIPTVRKIYEEIF